MTEQFDVFLCHNSKDKSLVRKISDQLKARGLNPWLDEEGISGGDGFMKRIQKVIVNVESALIFFGEHGEGKWQEIEIDVCYSRYVDKKLKVIPVLLPGVEEVPENQQFLGRLQWIKFSHPLDKTALDKLEYAIRSKEPQSTNVSSSSTFSVPKSSIHSTSSSPQSFIETLSGNIKLEMVKIPAGSFLMGSADNDESASDNEKPQHRVNLQEFYLGKYPVTQEQYQAVMGHNPSNFKSFFKDTSKNPVEKVSWDDAQEFCRKLSEKTGKKHRLPSEAEWEYACRAGIQTRYYFGDNEYQLGEYAWYGDNSGSKPHPVGQKKPNNWGLYDLHGNVWEWCEDGWHENYENAPKDGSSWNENNSPTSFRTARGGSWNFDPEGCRSAFRFGINAVVCFVNVGFRLAVSIF